MLPLLLPPSSPRPRAARILFAVPGAALGAKAGDGAGAAGEDWVMSLLARKPVLEIVECVGPQCGIKTVADVARKEGWKLLKRSDGSKLLHPSERTHVGWCAGCAKEFGVEG
ncbi:MAG: hypothetical protein KGL39_08035 [Patescibacteria group bacterium]|nr:hypothetical protein [Patescibacteria group bacterium]